MGLALHSVQRKHSVQHKTPLSPELPLPVSLRAHLLDKKLPWSSAASRRQPRTGTDISLHPSLQGEDVHNPLTPGARRLLWRMKVGALATR